MQFFSKSGLGFKFDVGNASLDAQLLSEVAAQGGLIPCPIADELLMLAVEKVI